MIWLHRGYILAPILAGLWMIVIVIIFSVIMTFCTGDSYKPHVILSFIFGAFSGTIVVSTKNRVRSPIFVIMMVIILAFYDVFIYFLLCIKLIF